MLPSDIKLGDLLRYAFSGAAGILALSLALFGDVQSNEDRSAFMLSGIALVLGGVIYAIHRGVIYPFIHKLILKRLKKPGTKAAKDASDAISLLPWAYSEFERRLDKARWNRMSPDATSQGIQPQLSEWGAQIHLLYCTAWAVMLAVVTAALHHYFEYNCVQHLGIIIGLVVFAFVCLFAGVASNCRLAQADFQYANEEQSPGAPLRAPQEPPAASPK